MAYKGKSCEKEMASSKLKEMKKIVSNACDLRKILTDNYPNHEFTIIGSWNDLTHLDSVVDAYFSSREAKQNCPRSLQKSKHAPYSKDYYIIATGRFRELAEGTMATGFSETHLDDYDIDFIYERLQFRLESY